MDTQSSFGNTDTRGGRRNQRGRVRRAMALSPFKKNKRWIWKAYDRAKRSCIAWVVGNRDASTLSRLWERIDKPGCTYFTDNWTSYPEVIPAERHIVGKRETHGIERDNSNTRHRIGRFNRRTKIVSHSELMIDLSMRLLTYFENPCNFNNLRKKVLSILD